MPKRPCLGLDGVVCNVLSEGSRCSTHTRAAANVVQQGKRERRPVLPGERARRAAAVDEHVLTHGWWCPGWGVPDHYDTDLTADHVEAVAAGGAEDGPLEVLCRGCNGRKGKTAGQRPATPPYVVRSE